MAIFRRQRMFERMAFSCDVCGHSGGDMTGLAYASADDVVDRSSPFPHLRSSWLMKMAAQPEDGDEEA